jgi:hypothetical protein
MAVDVSPLLVAPVAELGGEGSTGWTGDITVAAVQDRVVAPVLTPTRL